MSIKKAKSYLILHLAVFILSISTVCSKFAANEDFMSFNFVMLYVGVILALGIYAIVWQQVLKKIPLTDAFVNKSAILIWSLIWGVIFFNESISVSMVIGISIVIIGVILVVTNDRKLNVEKLKKTKGISSNE